MRWLLIAAVFMTDIALILACAHGGHSDHDYCELPFVWGDAKHWDLDGDGIAGGTDFAIHARECGER